MRQKTRCGSDFAGQKLSLHKLEASICLYMVELKQLYVTINKSAPIKPRSEAEAHNKIHKNERQELLWADLTEKSRLSPRPPAA